MSEAQQTRYSTGAIALHWIIAIAVIVNWRLAEYAHDLPDAERGPLMGWHATIGMTILLLSVLRLVWRWTHPAPPLSADLKAWERIAARSTHTIFYILLIGLPIGGWLGFSGYDAAVNFWGLFEIPPLPVGYGEDVGHEILEIHGTGGSIVILLVGLHILGALKHTLIDKDGNLWRMLPFGRPRV